MSTESFPSTVKSYTLYDRAKKLIPLGTHLLSKRPEIQAPGVWPVYFREAHGVSIVDVDGNEWTDMTGNVGATILGHADPDVSTAVEDAVRRGTFCMLNPPEEIELASLLTQIIPCAEQVRFARGGGEADAIAIRIARGYSGRDKVLFCGYHGWHDWYLAANLRSGAALNDHLLPGIPARGVPSALSDSIIPFEYNRIESFRDAINAHRGQIGAVIMEPTRHHPPVSGFLEEIREICTREKIVLIFDEVVTGFRMHLGGAQKYFNVTPDLAVFAKTISNGHPLGAVVGLTEFMAATWNEFISSTYWTDSIGPVAGLATIQKIQQADVIDHVWKMGKLLEDGLREAIRKSGVPVELAGWPPLQILEFKHSDPRMIQAMESFYIQQNLKRGFLGAKVHYLTLAHTSDIITRYLEAAGASFRELKKALEDGDLVKKVGKHMTEPFFRRLV